MLPPAELHTAILHAVERNVEISHGACAVEVTRMLGFKSTSAGMRKLVASQAGILVESGRMRKAGAQLKPPRASG